MNASQNTTATKSPKPVKAPKVNKSKPVESGWTRCSGCWTSVRHDTTPSACKTCEKVSNKELLVCECGSTKLKVYRAKGFSPRNCIRCIFLGKQDIRTAAQEEAIERYDLCSGVCGLVQPVGRTFCHDCQAVADIEPSLRKKLNDVRAQLRTSAREDRWNKTMWSGVFADMDAKIKAEKDAVEAATKALIDEQNETENFLRILRFAQSGKARAQGVSVRQPDAPVIKTVAKTPAAQPLVPTPVVVMTPRSKIMPPCRTKSLADFPLLGS